MKGAGIDVTPAHGGPPVPGRARRARDRTPPPAGRRIKTKLLLTLINHITLICLYFLLLLTNL